MAFYFAISLFINSYYGVFAFVLPPPCISAKFIESYDATVNAWEN